MPTEIITNGSRWAGDRVAMFDPYSMWLAFYREPTSIIFNRTPANWDELNTLILAKRIDFSGLYDSGGHPLYQTQPVRT